MDALGKRGSSEQLASSPSGCHRCDAKRQAAAGTQAEPSLSLALRPSREGAHRQIPPPSGRRGFPQRYASCCRALLLGSRHRPLSLPANGGVARAPPSYRADQWRRRRVNALLPHGPMAACPGARAAPASRGGGQAAASSAPLPSDPVSSRSVFLFQTTWTRRGPPWSLSRSQLPALRAHGDPGALPQLRGVQLLAPAAGPVHPERAPGQNPEDSGQGRQPGPSR